MANYGEFIGVSNLYYATISADSATAYTAGTPAYLAPVANIAIEPNVNTKTRYYDNQAYYTTTTEGETKVTCEISGLSFDTMATILGKHYDTTAKRLYDVGAAEAPYVALGFKANVEGGAKYYWFLKGKFAAFKEEAATQTDDIDPKTIELEFTAINTEHNKFNVNSEGQSLKLVAGDNRLDTTLTDTVWFASVQKPADIT